MRTVGLDFGTHQSKVCVETKEGAELNYEFFMFKDAQGKEQYTLPSIINRDRQGFLTYGYVPRNKRGQIIRYFKQATFTDVGHGMDSAAAIYYSIWYIAFILFDLEDKYGQDFAIQMGVPSDGERLNQRRQHAVRILLSAYHLVEEVFQNDKEKFLNTKFEELVALTEFLPYSKDKKEEYSILVFPEAYACLMPLIKSAKIATGMSLMVDIGGGTTDISFFTIEHNKPQVYTFYSIDKGLNYLTDADRADKDRKDSNVHDASEILSDRRKNFEVEVNRICYNLLQRLIVEFKKQCHLPQKNLTDALKSRPIIYTGGGSTFSSMRSAHGGFRDVLHISNKEWRTEAVIDMNRINMMSLCPILSTAYGLSISVADDKIKTKPFRDIFKHIRGVGAENQHKKNKPNSNFGKALGGFNYADDWDAWK